MSSLVAGRPSNAVSESRDTAWLAAHIAPNRGGNEASAIADGYDLLLTPTLARIPFPVGSFTNDPADPFKPSRLANEWVRFTAQFNMSGQPAISLPMGRTVTGLPVGVQLVAAYGRDDVLLRVAAQLETAAPWKGFTPTALG